MSTALDVIREKAREAHARQQLLVAEQHYRTLLKAEPHIDDVINLGALLRSQGRLKEGSLFYRQWINHFEKDERLILNACNCWNDNNEPQLALDSLKETVQKGNAQTKSLICYADSLARLGRTNESTNILEICIKSEPNNKEAWVRIGHINAKEGKLNHALEALNRASQIDENDLEVISNRITILKDLGQFKEAETLIGKLKKEQRQQVDIAQATAGLLMAQNKLTEATDIYRILCEKKPKNANYWLNWAAALRGLRWTVAPYKILQRALCYEPLNRDVQEALLQIIAEMAKDDATQRCMNLWPSDDNSAKDIYLFNRQFLGIGTNKSDSGNLAKQARAWEKKYQSNTNINLWQDTILMPTNNRKLRIGYLSADFANHPVGRFMLPVLSNHDRDVVEIWALSCGSHDDWITEQIRKQSDHWVDLKFQTISENARILADLRLDIIVELGGFSANSPLKILCHRPAPIQLSYLGYPGPTYLESIDGWIGDEVLFKQLDPVDKNAHNLIEIDGGYMVFDTGGELPIPKRSTNSRFRFGSFNHARKLTQETINLFCKVMEANPEADLVLKSISFCEAAEKTRIRKRFEKTGLQADRLLLLDWVEGGLNHLKLYGEIDVALDPIPYGGATTTAEALWMGVPVVAMEGKGMVGQLAASLLFHGDQKQWIADNKEQYLKIASDLANKGPRYDKDRYKLRLELQKSSLAIGRRLSKELEKNYINLAQDIR